MKRQNPRAQLKAYGVSRGIGVRRRPWLFVLLIGFLAVLSGFLYEKFRSTASAMDGSKVATAVVALGALILGYQQWRYMRFETSIEKFFEKLETINKRLVESDTLRDLLDAVDEKANYQQSMYVFAEIDNLDYVMQKYQYGFMSSEQALRGVRTFRARCVHRKFRDRAAGCLEVGGYGNEIKEVFRRICDQIDSEQTNR